MLLKQGLSDTHSTRLKLFVRSVSPDAMFGQLCIIIYEVQYLLGTKPRLYREAGRLGRTPPYALQPCLDLTPPCTTIRDHCRAKMTKYRELKIMAVPETLR